MKKQRLTEQIEFLAESVSDDRTIPVKIIQAGASGNRRRYSAGVLRSAVPMFEGATTYMDHPSREDIRSGKNRSTREVTGWIKDVKFDEAKQALVGTRHFAPTAARQ